MLPAAVLGESEDTFDRSLRDDREVRALGNVSRGAVELIEQRRPALAVDGHDVTEELRDPERMDIGIAHAAVQARRAVGRCPVRSCALEHVVLGHDASGRKRAPRFGDPLHRAAQFDLLAQQLVPSRAVFG